VTNVPISSVKVGDRHRRELGSLADLKASIEEVGLLHPIVLTEDHVLVAGQRRLEACRGLGWEDIPARVLPLSSSEALQAQHDENQVRKDFLPSERVAIAETIRDRERAAAEDREREGGRLGGEGSGNLPDPSRGRARDKVAQSVGWSGSTYEKARKVVQAAEQDPAYQDLVDEMDRSGKVDPAFRKLGARQGPSAVDMFVAAGADVKRARYRHQFAKAMAKADDFLQFDPEDVASLCDEGDIRSLAALVEQIAEFHRRVVAAHPKPFTLIKGGSR
jgi:ParB-like chromosome segregation protein Spo0J